MFPLEPADGAFLTDPAGEFLISSSIFQGEPSLDPDSFYQTLDGPPVSHFQGPNDFENILTDFEPDSIDYLGAESSINYDLLGAEPLIDYSNPDLNSAEHILDDSIAFEGSLTPEEKPFGFEDGWPEWDELFGPEENLEIAQATPDPSDTSGLVEPVSFPAICSAFKKENPDKTGSQSFTPVYGEGGLFEGRIVGYYTEFYIGYTGRECGKPETQYCCSDPRNGSGCIRPSDNNKNIIPATCAVPQ